MFFLNSAADENPCKALYSGQSIVQKILIILAILCIPAMLLGKPIILYLRHKRQSQVNFYFFVVVVNMEKVLIDRSAVVGLGTLESDSQRG